MRRMEDWKYQIRRIHWEFSWNRKYFVQVLNIIYEIMMSKLFSVSPLFFRPVMDFQLASRKEIQLRCQRVLGMGKSELWITPKNKTRESKRLQDVKLFFQQLHWVPWSGTDSPTDPSSSNSLKIKNEEFNFKLSI